MEEDYLNAIGGFGGGSVNPPNVSDPSVNPGLSQYMNMLGMNTGQPSTGMPTVPQTQLAAQQPGAARPITAAPGGAQQPGYVAPSWVPGGQIGKAGCAC